MPIFKMDTRQLEGDIKVAQRLLRDLGRRTISSQRKAMNQTLNTPLATARQKAPKVQGQLKKSIAKKVWQKEFTVYGMVGQDAKKITKQAQRVSSGRGRKSRKATGGLSGKGYIPAIHMSHNRLDSHHIAAQPGGVLRWRTGGRGRGAQYAYARHIDHPGTNPPKVNWLTKLGQMHWTQYRAEYEHWLEAYTNQEAAKLAKKGVRPRR